MLRNLHSWLLCRLLFKVVFFALSSRKRSQCLCGVAWKAGKAILFLLLGGWILHNAFCPKEVETS